MRVQGQCHCGEIRFEAEVDPKMAGICHCIDCQILTGSPYRVSVPSTKFQLLSGKPKIYMKVAESGNKRAQGFCGNCGTPIYATSAENPVTYNLRTGCLEEREMLPPQKQIWCRSARSWSGRIEHLPKKEKG